MLNIMSAFYNFTSRDNAEGALFPKSWGEKVETWQSQLTYQVSKFTQQGQEGSTCSGLSGPVDPDTVDSKRAGR